MGAVLGFGVRGEGLGVMFRDLGFEVQHLGIGI